MTQLLVPKDFWYQNELEDLLNLGIDRTEVNRKGMWDHKDVEICMKTNYL